MQLVRCCHGRWHKRCFLSCRSSSSMPSCRPHTNQIPHQCLVNQIHTHGLHPTTDSCVKAASDSHDATQEKPWATDAPRKVCSSCEQNTWYYERELLPETPFLKWANLGWSQKLECCAYTGHLCFSVWAVASAMSRNTQISALTSGNRTPNWTLTSRSNTSTSTTAVIMSKTVRA